MLKMYREDFRNFLNTSKKYDPNVVLKLLDGSWMMEEIILLLINTGQHERALETYLDRNMDKEAEEFCTQTAPEKKVLTSLFEIYMKRYKIYSEECIKASSQGQGVAKFSKFKDEKQKCELFAMNILKKYGTNSSLDSARVLKAIPDDYNLFDSRNGMMKYLNSMLDHKLTTKINSSIGEKLCSKEHKNVEYKLSMKKKAYVKITSDCICGVCKARIDITKLFVYPNGQIVHKHCGKENSNRCPVTKQLFTPDFA